MESMIKLTDQMRELINNALANGCPCILATATTRGEPDIGFKGSMMVFDDESLAYWERTRRQHLKNLSENPKVVVLFRDPKTRVNFRFHGAAAVHQQGSVRDQVMARTVKYSLTLENNTDSGTDKNTDKHADSYIAEAKVTYQNLGTFSWKTTRYRTYTRLYVPAGSDLIGVWADGVPLHAIDVRPGKVDVYSEFGKFAFGVFFEVEPQKAKTIVWKYKLPEAINAQIKNGEYSLLVQKQPGIIDFNLQLDLQFAQKIKQSVKGLSAAKNQIKHAEVVDRDQIYNVWLDE